MFKKVLIANRGEIAARIIKTCRRLGVGTVAIYSEADAGAPHTTLADEAYLVGPAHVTQSYLNIPAIIEVLKQTGADAVHPGYGLLSENSDFVAAVVEAGATFIGPSVQVMELMGDKARARAFAQQAGVPVVPGTPGAITTDEEALAFAQEAGYPVLVKAAGGGGGIGMKVATNDKKLIKAIEECRRRGESAFGNPEVYVEKYIQDPHHIEVQVLADAHGTTLHLFERECSVQRRHQKVIEESPSPLVERHPGMRERICQAAVELTRAASYVNAGTVEFIADRHGAFYFIEMNTRLQVEHPVTEAITGVDLVEQQLLVASGQPLAWTQEALTAQGHAIECRIYAEDPAKMFLPAPGQIGAYEEPRGPGVRVDSGAAAGREVTPYYDPMIAKVITHGQTRQEAIERMSQALSHYTIEGLTTNLSMHLELMQDEDFLRGEYHTGWLEQRKK